MKKTKKHTFSHKDPEKEAAKKTDSGENVTKSSYSYKEEPYVDQDLKRGLLVILFLGILLAFLYYAQTRTQIFAPVLKYFGL